MSTSTAPFTLAPGVYDDLSAEAYHSIRAVSATVLKTFVRKTPAHAKALLDGRMKDETSAMARGTALHSALLEPGQFEKSYRVGPEVNRNTKEWKAFAAECEAAGVEPMKPSESLDVLGMRDALWAEPSVRKLLLACDRRELSIVWNGPHGLLCKARIDLYSTASRCLLDVKTTGDGDEEKFKATAYRMGYHLQLAHYASALAAHGLPCRSTGFLVPEVKCPWVPCIYQPNADMFRAGRDAVETALADLARCEESGVWPGYMADGRPVALALPKWSTEMKESFNV